MAQSPKKPPNDAVTCPRCGADKWIHGAEVCALAVGLQVRVEQVPGKKWFAIAPKASEINERFYVGAQSEFGRFVLTQIAGLMARRIVCKVRKGDTIDRGARYGMIKLGSKVDIYLPAGIVPSVKIGDMVKAGETVIGVVKA